MKLVKYAPGVTVFDCLDVEAISAQQHVNAFPFFAEFFARNPVDRIIEIGTAGGGLALYFRELNPTVPIDTYDIISLPVYAKLNANGITTHCKNVFGPVTVAELHASIQAPGRALLFCDGGCKVNEFNTFAPSLKPGDVIMAHDYCADRAKYAAGMQAIWPWWEIKYDDIAHTMRTVPLHQIAPESENAAIFAAQR